MISLKSFFSNFCSHIKDSKLRRKYIFINCVSCNGSPKQIPFQFANGNCPIPVAEHSRPSNFWSSDTTFIVLKVCKSRPTLDRYLLPWKILANPLYRNLNPALKRFSLEIENWKNQNYVTVEKFLLKNFEMVQYTKYWTIKILIVRIS